MECELCYLLSAGTTKLFYLSGVVGLDRASVKGRWEFGKRRGALLIMAHPSSSRIPPQVLLKDLVSFPEFKENYLVTQVYHCNAYGLYFSTEGMSCVHSRSYPISDSDSLSGW